MGCTSDLGGNFGIVWIVQDQPDLDHILKNGPTPPYMAILGRTFFTRKNLLVFKQNPDRVSGVVFLDGDHDDSKSRTSPFSPDDTCPNRYSGLYANHTDYSDCKKNTWQKESPISGLLYDDLPFPIFLINDDKSIDEIQTCFKNNNVLKSSKTAQASYPLCGLQLDSFMNAAQNSDLCLNSHFFIDELLQTNGRRCYPVDNHNIFGYYKTAKGPLHPIVNITEAMTPDMAPPQSVVMLVAKLSSLSMFSELSPGADSTITSIVTMLAIAEALSRVKNSTEVMKSERNIAFALLDSEPFDYTGSNRMVYSMIHDVFPNSFFRRTNETDAMQNLNLKSIEYVINLDQLANYPSDDSLHFHSEPEDSSRDKVDTVFNTLEKFASNEKLKLSRADSQMPLPPTPVHEFIRYSRQQKYGKENELTGLVLTNYGEKYNNLFYHSTYDDSHNINRSETKLVDHIAQVAKVVASSLYELAFKADKSQDINVDKLIVEQLLQCYLFDAGCHLFTRASTAGQKLPSGPIETYKDPTKRSDDMNGVITAHLLAYFLGDKIHGHNITDCIVDNQRSQIYNFEYINDKDEPVSDGTSGVCVRSQVALLSAQSPAFSDSEEGIKIDDKYPAWTVSLNGIRNPVRLYLKPSPVTQWATFLLGIVITIASFVIVHQIKAKVTNNGGLDPAISQIATPT